jgi:hypothetical protein
MGYASYFYVETIRAVDRRGASGLRFIKRCREVSRAVFLGNLSVAWLLGMVEEMLKGENLREFYWTLRVGSRAYIALRYVNSNGRYLASVEYGKGG